MSFKVKGPKVTDPPATPLQDMVNPLGAPQDARRRRLATQGRSSTFLGSAVRAAASLPSPGGTLTGVGG